MSTDERIDRFLELAQKFSKIASEGHYTVEDMFIASLTNACYSGKACGHGIFEFQKIAFKIWGSLPEEIKPDETKPVQ